MSDASDLEQALAELKNLYSIERKYSIRLVDAFKNPGPDMVEESDRDAAVRDLRLLRMWCELPPSVFFTAVNILDRFLTCMRVKIKYLECLAMSCFYLATWLEHKAIDLGKILKISYTKCSENDVLRMADIVKGKLSLVEGEHVVTGLDYLKVVMRMSNMFAEVMHLKPFFTGKAMVRLDITFLKYIYEVCFWRNEHSHLCIMSGILQKNGYKLDNKQLNINLLHFAKGKCIHIPS